MCCFKWLTLPYACTVHSNVLHSVCAWQNTSDSVFLFCHSPDAWTSVTYCSNSCPWWMTSKVRLFIVSALSAWCCSLCSASVRSSVSKSLICWDSSSFHDSRSEMIWEGGKGQAEWDRWKSCLKGKMRKNLLHSWNRTNKQNYFAGMFACQKDNYRKQKIAWSYVRQRSLTHLEARMVQCPPCEDNKMPCNSCFHQHNNQM